MKDQAAAFMAVAIICGIIAVKTLFRSFFTSSFLLGENSGDGERTDQPDNSGSFYNDLFVALVLLAIGLIFFVMSFGRAKNQF